MNPNPDAATVQQALQLFYVLGGSLILLGLVKAVLDIIGFFRRQPPIDQTIAVIVREFNEQLNQRVHKSDWATCERRHAEQLQAVDARYAQQFRDMEGRLDKRFEGLHESLVELRQTTLNLFNDITRALGQVEGRPGKG